MHPVLTPSVHADGILGPTDTNGALATATENNHTGSIPAPVGSGSLPLRTHSDAPLIDKHSVSTPESTGKFNAEFVRLWAAQTAAADLLAERVRESTVPGSSSKNFDADMCRPRSLVAKPPSSRRETLTPRPGIGCAAMNAHHSLTNPKWRALRMNSPVARPTTASAMQTSSRVSSLTPYGSFSLSSPQDHGHLDRLAVSSRIGTGSPWSFATGRVHPATGSHDGWPQPLGGGFRHTHREFERQWSLRAPKTPPHMQLCAGQHLSLLQR